MAYGTDAGVFPHGQNARQFPHMLNGGLTPMQALVSATSGAAQAIHINQQTGSLEKGKWADFLVLNANPLDDIRNTRNIDSVWIGGVQVATKR